MIQRGRKLLIVLVLSALAGLFGCRNAKVPVSTGSAPAQEAGRMLVAASIVPIADFVAQVGGDRVEVLTMVPPGKSPHIYEPTPDQMRRLSRARLLVLNGVGLEFWSKKAVEAAANPDLKVVVLSEGMDILGVDRAHNHEHTSGNPHLWLSPRRAMVYVERIRDALIAVDPAGKEVYWTNAKRYLDELRKLDAEAREVVQRVRSRNIVVFHAAWDYFAHDYGLRIAAVIQKTPGKEPSPREIAEVVETLKREHAGALFAEPQLPPQAAQVIASEAGVPVLYLNPLGGVPPHEHYVDMMRDNLRQLEKALR